MVAAEGERSGVTDRISQAKGSWPEGVLESPARCRVSDREAGAEGVILSGLGQGDAYRKLT